MCYHMSCFFLSNNMSSVIMKLLSNYCTVWCLFIDIYCMIYCRIVIYKCIVIVYTLYRHSIIKYYEATIKTEKLTYADEVSKVHIACGFTVLESYFIIYTLLKEHTIPCLSLLGWKWVQCFSITRSTTFILIKSIMKYIIFTN